MWTSMHRAAQEYVDKNGVTNADPGARFYPRDAENAKQMATSLLASPAIARRVEMLEKAAPDELPAAVRAFLGVSPRP